MAEMLKDQEQILKNGFDLMQHLHKVRLTTETVIIYGVALEPIQYLFLHVFSAIFAAYCVKNPCHTSVCLRIFSL